uniref:Uncharacterized protein n=1 Tax=Polysiphonia sertularioides TaxID=945028 RepID=A0A1Z1MFV8_9FLOR|nr:hypothetical protein [Polysiphonia sertularioides]
MRYTIYLLRSVFLIFYVDLNSFLYTNNLYKQSHLYQLTMIRFKG